MADFSDSWQFCHSAGSRLFLPVWGGGGWGEKPVKKLHLPVLNYQGVSVLCAADSLKEKTDDIRRAQCMTFSSVVCKSASMQLNDRQAYQVN